MRRIRRRYDLGGTTDRKRSDEQYDQAINAVGSIPVYGQAIQGFSSIGTGIGKQTVDENGIYHDKTSEHFDNAFNPKTGINNIKNIGRMNPSNLLNFGTAGLLGKSFGQKQAEEEAQRRRNIIDAQAIREGGIKTGLLNSEASNSNQIYAKYGGAIPINKYINGGNLKGLSEENEEVDGNSHSEGGVQISPDVEVEGGETINTEGKEPFVFSEKLGFAKLHKPIARAIGKLEKKVPNNITKNTIQLLKQREEALKQQQEQFKKQLGLKGVNEYELGGRIKKHSPFEDDYAPYINIDNHIYKIPKRR